MFSAIALVYLVFVLADLVLAYFEIKRFRDGLKKGDPKLWTYARFWFLFGLIGSMLDTIRLFIGGFWSDIPEGEEPVGAKYIYPMLVLHAFVALIVTGIFELAVASFKFEEEGLKTKIARAVFALVSLALTIIALINVYAEIALSEEHIGLIREEKFGIVRFTPGNLTLAQEFGYLAIPGTELAGVIWFSLVAVGVGAVVFYNIRWPWLCVLSVVTLIGQGIGPLVPDYFYFASNGWEMVTFLSLVWADYKVFNQESEGASNTVVGKNPVPAV